MVDLHLSIKHFEINKANNRLIVTVAVAVIISVFCLVSAKSLLGQSAYQRRVLAAKHTAANQLKANVVVAQKLLVQYQVFEDSTPNIIGGQGGRNPGNGPSDGDNAQIVLDALPSQYDFPALISSLEKILGSEGVSVQGIGGTDAGQPETLVSGSLGNVQPVPITFSVEASTSYSNSKKVIQDFERSIRPVSITNLQLSGTQDSMHITINATTYYQPAKTFSVGSKELR